MKVFKFGGASIRDANAVRNMTAIIKAHANEPLVVVISAMDKTTNAMEEIIDLYNKLGNANAKIEILRNKHFETINELFSEPDTTLKEIDPLFIELTRSLHHKGDDDCERQYQPKPAGNVCPRTISTSSGG